MAQQAPAGDPVSSNAAAGRRKTKHEKALAKLVAELAFSNPGVKTAVAAVAQSPPSSSATSRPRRSGAAMAQQAQAGDPASSHASSGGLGCPLKNLGNTCYMNAILQVLVDVPGIKQVLAGSTASTAASESLLLLLRELMDILSSGDESTAVSPKALVDSLFDPDSKWVTKYKAEKGQQHSADEFLQYLLEQVPELQSCVAFDMLDVNQTVQPSTILHVMLVPRAGKVPLSALIHAQFTCKDIPFSNFKSVLIVVVKRWRNEENGNISRDSTEILLSDPLELYDKGGRNIAQFSLSGFVYHQGRSPTGGHYTAFSQRTINDEVKWLLFDDDKKPKERGEEQIKIKAESSFILIFSRTGAGDDSTIPDELKEQVRKVQDGILQDEEEIEWQQASPEMINQARAYADKMKPVLDDCAEEDADHRQSVKYVYVKKLCKGFECSEKIAMKALNLALGPEPSLVPFSPAHVPPDDDLCMWDNRARWDINATIPNKELVYKLVDRLVQSNPILCKLLSVDLNDPNVTIFIQKPEQSGKTMACVIMAWLSNICYQQAAYLLLRSGGAASEDYLKFGVNFENFNKEIWQAVVGYTFESPTGDRVDRVYQKHEQYDQRLWAPDLHTTAAREGFMKPYEMHYFEIKDQHLQSDLAREVLKHKYPIVFSRLATAANIHRSINQEMEKMIQAYGVDEQGFAKMTLLIDEYQQLVTEGNRVQEELHQPLCNNERLFEVLASAIAVTDGSGADRSERQQRDELERRFQVWEDENKDGLDACQRRERSAVSACIRAHVRISATVMSGMIASEAWDLRRPVPLELQVDSPYFGHKSSLGMDPRNEINPEWRGSSNLDHISASDYPFLDQSVVCERIQKFVMDEISSEVGQDGYAHILIQSLGGNNSSLLDQARFFIGYTDHEFPEKPTIAVTAYMFTTAGPYPGGPWLVFSQAALPLLALIPDIAEDLFIDRVQGLNVVPEGKVVMRNGSSFAKGIRENIAKLHGQGFTNGLQLPKHSQLYLPAVLTLVNCAIEKSGYDKSTIKIITVGAGQLKVGMTPKTLNHSMSVTLGLLNATEKQEKNMTYEDVSQGLAGRISGSRKGDPYFEARGHDGPPRLVGSGLLRDKLNNYKNLQKQVLNVAKERANGKLVDRLSAHDFKGFKDMPPDTPISKSNKRKNANGANLNFRTVSAIVGGGTTGTGAWCLSRKEGFLSVDEKKDRIRKFNDLKEEHPDLFKTSDPTKSMPVFGNKIWKAWGAYDAYRSNTVTEEISKDSYEASVIDVEVKNQELIYTLCFDGKILPPNLDQVTQYYHLDFYMEEWSYDTEMSQKRSRT